MADTRDFLLEIGTEEMPSAPLVHATKQIADLVRTGLDEAGLAHGELRSSQTPRRLVVRVSDVALATKEVREVKRRTLRADGGSRAWINGRAATMGQLAELAALLVEIHGQHEHRALLSRASQLALLDAWARPQIAARKVYVLRDAQLMNLPAQNAALKRSRPLS